VQALSASALHAAMKRAIGAQGMNTAPVHACAATLSPNALARIAGVFYLFTILMGMTGVALRSSLVVSIDAPSTAVRVLAHATQYRLSFVADFIGMSCYIGVTAMFYELFRPVNRTLSRLSAFVSLVGCAVGAVSLLFELAPFTFLSEAPYLGAFSTGQLQALALVFLTLGGQTNNIGLALFGMYCLTIGFLIVRSTFLPRGIGVLMMLSGTGWLTFVYPPLSKQLFEYSVSVGLLGETSLALWLLIKGVNTPQWPGSAERAHAKGT
jgi:hypothetical protein